MAHHALPIALLFCALTNTAWASDQPKLIADRSKSQLSTKFDKDEDSEYLRHEVIKYTQRGPALFGFGGGLGLNIYPTMRLEGGFHGRDNAGFVSLAFESSAFSNNHFLAKALLLDTFDRNIEERRLMLNYRSTGEMYFHAFLGYENQRVKLKKTVSEESSQLRDIITGTKQNYIFGASLGSRFSFGVGRLNIDWIGLLFSKQVRAASFLDRGQDATDEEVNKLSDSYRNESGFSMRFLNMSAFIDL